MIPYDHWLTTFERILDIDSLSSLVVYDSRKLVIYTVCALVSTITLVATSKHPALLVKYLETHLSELEIWLREWRIAINVGKSAAVLFTTRRTPPPRPLRFLGEEIRWEEKVKYLGVTLDRRLTWSSHIDQVRRKASQRLGILSPLLNKRSGLSIRNGLMLYRQLIRPMMDYACPVWRHAANSHIKRLQVLAYNCGRTLVRQQFAIARGPGGSLSSRTHQESCPQFRL